MNKLSEQTIDTLRQIAAGTPVEVLVSPYEDSPRMVGGPLMDAAKEVLAAIGEDETIRRLEGFNAAICNANNDNRKYGKDPYRMPAERTDEKKKQIDAHINFLKGRIMPGASMIPMFKDICEIFRLMQEEIDALKESK